MPTTEKVSTGGLAAAIALSLAIALVWAIALATLSDLSGSDAAGNGLAQAFGAIELFVLWALLAILTLIAAVNGAMPPVAKLAALILVPATGVAAFVAQNLLAKPEITPYLWPLVVPAVTPPLVIIFSLWSLIPDLRRVVPAGLATGVFIAGLAGVCVALGPMIQARKIAVEKLEAEREKVEAAYASLPADATLWDLAPFLGTPDSTRESEVLDRIINHSARQSEAEQMLDRGDFPLRYLGRIDLEPTPRLCDKARVMLRRQAASLVVRDANPRPYTDIVQPLEDALAAMRWMVGYNCACDQESLAWEQMANGYSNTSLDVHELKELRDPRALGRELREDPDRFSMLTPNSHLKGWLKFTDDKDLQTAALAGARKLDHRTADAIEMLNADEYTAWRALEYLPELDLDATPTLCAAALAQVHRELKDVYRPTADNPLPYREMLERMGTGEPLPALIWLARHGCAPTAELSEAEQLVQTYQDAPERAAMLATLGQLQGKQ